MIREFPHTRVFTRALSALLATCLILGMAPSYAFGDEAAQAGTGSQQRISEDVRVAPNAALDEASGGAVASEEAATGESADIASPVVSSGEAQALDQVVAEVPVVGNVAVHKTLLVDGLEFAVDSEARIAALVGWYGTSPKGDLVLPSQISDGKSKYEVVAIGKLVDDTINEPSNKPSDASRNSAGGGPYLMPQNFSL